MAAIAELQRGIVTWQQMRAVGLTADQICTRVNRRQLRRLHRGVYTMTQGELPPLAVEQAALLACGRSALLSHLTAFNIWRVLPNPVVTRTVHVLTARGGGRGRQLTGITLHHTTALTATHVRRHERLPVTSPERTLLDCAVMLQARQLERALDESLAKRLTSLTKLREMLTAYPYAPGRKRLAELVDGRDGPTVTNEEMEERFLLLIREAGLPEPQTQVLIYDQSIDFYWPEARFGVELDSRTWHMIPSKFNNDRRKDQILRDHGIVIARSTWNQLTEHPFELVAHVSAQIGLRNRSAA